MIIVRRSLMSTFWRGRLKRFNQGVLAMAVAGGTCAYGQANLPIYTDRLVNGFDDWSWAPRSLTNTAPVHSGDCSISVTASAWQALSVHHAPLNTSLYDSLSFWVKGGMNGGQVLQIQALLNGIAPKTRALPALPPHA